MHAGMAGVAEGDQIWLCIIACLAAELFVVDFEVGHRAAGLASPAIPAQNLLAKLVV